MERSIGAMLTQLIFSKKENYIIGPRWRFPNW